MATPATEKPPLQLHIEPVNPIEVDELTSALAAIARQYRQHLKAEGMADKLGDARLLVSSISPGSIDIGLSPDQISTVIQTGSVAITAAAGYLTAKLDIVNGLVEKIRTLLGYFKNKPTEQDVESIKLSDCNDAIAITAPVANNGGTQIFNTHNGNVYNPVLVVTGIEARQIRENALHAKALKKFPEAERFENVALIWYRADSEAGRLEGSSPDKVIVEELDKSPKTVLFNTDVAYLKQKMVSGDPFNTVYFVDIEVSRVSGKVVSYRVIALHGQDFLT